MTRDGKETLNKKIGYRNTNKTSFTFRFLTSDFFELEQEALQKGESIASILRRIIRDYLRQQEATKGVQNTKNQEPCC